MQPGVAREGQTGVHGQRVNACVRHTDVSSHCWTLYLHVRTCLSHHHCLSYVAISNGQYISTDNLLKIVCYYALHFLMLIADPPVCFAFSL